MEPAPEERYEFVDGVVHLMPDGPLNDATIKASLYTALWRALRR